MVSEPLNDRERELIQRAAEVREHAYVPYSKFRVGAALLGADGGIHVGCNVENASYGLTVCAERNAIAAAIAADVSEFQTIAIVTEASELAAPCGACRQVLAEFSPQMQVILSSPDGNTVKRLELSDLLPERFSL